MIRFLLLLLVPFFCNLNLFSQSESSKTRLSEYFELPRESVYLHLNKSTYVQGDEIWFSGYVYDRRGEVPFTKTTNIYVGVHDSDGNLITQGLYLGQNGHFKGNIFVDGTYAAGDYYVRASTRWMKNFREDDSHVQRIKVVNPLVDSSTKTTTDKGYDVQFLPEGGNLITGIYNNLGVKVLNEQGLGIVLRDVEVYDSNGDRITVFDTSRFGMAKFELRPEAGLSYRAKVRLPDGAEQWYDLPSSVSQGINVKLNLNPHQGRIGVVFAMNKLTYNQIGNQDHYFLLHQNGISKKIPVSFDEDNFKATFFLEDVDLKAGVNTITLFNNNDRPILERMFFVTDGLKHAEPSFQLNARGKDSLRLTVTSDIDDLRLSVSLLPAASRSYEHRNNILSAFSLTPYVRGFVENPKYYFTEMDKRKEYELDLLLLTQGWSRYRWEDVRLGPLKPVHPFEDGITLKTAINGLGPKFRGNLMLYSTKYHGKQLLPITSEENQFLIQPFFPENGEELYFTLLDEKGRTSRPGGYFKLLNERIQERIEIPKQQNVVLRSIASKSQSNNVNQQVFIKNKTVILDEVEVVEDKVIPGPTPDSHVYIASFIKNKVTMVTPKMVRDNFFLEDYLRNFYDVRISRQNNLIITSRRGQNGFGSNVGVNLIVDDMQQRVPLPARIPMGQIEAIWIDRFSRYLGTRNDGFGEALYIYTKRGKEILPYGEPNDKNIYVLKVKNGFESPKDFYLPKYSTFENQVYNEYGVIHWEPELVVDKNGMGVIDILNTGQRKLTIHVEGMSRDGTMVSFSKTMDVGANQ